MVIPIIGLTLVAAGALIAARVAVIVHRNRHTPSTGAHGAGIALGGGLIFWGALLLAIDSWMS